MRKLTLVCALLIILATKSYSQTLFHYGNNPVDKKEFLRVYEKNAINQKPDYSKQALEEYLDLYSLFRMKVTEAEKMSLDTMTSIQYELANYRKQLVKNYLTDEQVQNKLIKEAYDRMKENVKVAHIMTLSSPMSPAEDTVEPYRIIDSVYKAIVNKGASFEDLAKKYSADKQTAPNGGNLGYITALQTVYPFENAAYNTPVGKVSKPFRSPYGYHIVKVLDRRKAIGEIKVAQILIHIKKSEGDNAEKDASEEAMEVYNKLKAGADFKTLVQEHSDDTYSKNNDGELQPFGVGQMVGDFEKAAFALNKPGDFSKPVKTDYGYHIIKLIEKYPLPDYDSMKPILKARIEKDSRAQVARDIFYQGVKDKNNFKDYPESMKEMEQWFKDIPAEGEKANTFTAEDYKGSDKPLFTVNGTAYTQSDMVTYSYDVTRGRLMGPRQVVFRNLYDNYLITVLNDIVEQNLIDENPDFKHLMEEYRAGIMLFELMDRNVWGKASKDSTGLEQFHSTRKDKYQWNPGFKGAVYTVKNEDVLKKALKIIGKKDITDEDIAKKLNTEDMPDAVSIEHGYYEFNKFDKFSKAQITEGKASESKKNEDGTYSVVFAEKVYNEKHPKTLDEARGYVIADYQDHLEKKWNQELRDKYPVKVDNEVFNSMVK